MLQKKMWRTLMGQAMLSNALAGYANVSAIAAGMREASTRNHNSTLFELGVNTSGR